MNTHNVSINFLYNKNIISYCKNYNFNIILAIISSCITLPPALPSNYFTDDNILDANLSIIQATESKLNFII